MILRRITEHVASQNWTAIAIDFFIVVVGVFIGIQVANWNEVRQESIRANEYLTRLAADLENDVDRFDNRIKRWTTSMDHGTQALQHVRNGVIRKENSWEVLVDFFQASDWLPFESSSTTFQEMKSAGELSLIVDTSLRDAVSTYYYTVDWRQPLYNSPPPYRKTLRGLTPIPIRNYLLSQCDITPGATEDVDCREPDLEVDAMSIVNEYAATSQVIQDLRFRVINLDVTVNVAKIDRDMAADLANRVHHAHR